MCTKQVGKFDSMNLSWNDTLEGFLQMTFRVVIIISVNYRSIRNDKHTF